MGESPAAIALISPEGLFADIRLPWPSAGAKGGGLLEAMAAAADVLPSGARLKVRLKASDREQDRSALAADQPLLCALAGRCGFEPEPDRSHSESIKPLEGEAKAPPVGAIYFRRASRRPRWRLAGLGEGDFADFASLFAAAFGHPVTLNLWRWKYAEGRGLAVTAWRDQAIIAHYGGMLRQVLVFGKPVMAIQVCDAMVAPKERGVMSKSGAMVQVTATFLELFMGLARFPLAFGFPNQRAMALGELTGLYAEVGRLAEVSWPARQATPRLGSRLVDFQPEQIAHRRAVEDLWTAMAQDLGQSVIGVRDWPYLRHRYLEHPEHRYRLVLVMGRLTTRPLGLLILRPMAERLAWIDWVAPLRHQPLLLKQARRLAALWGHETLYGWIPRHAVNAFQTDDMDARKTEISIPTNAWVPQPWSADQLRDRWWLTMGDTDFL